MGAVYIIFGVIVVSSWLLFFSGFNVSFPKWINIPLISIIHLLFTIPMIFLRHYYVRDFGKSILTQAVLVMIILDLLVLPISTLLNMAG